MKPFLLPALAIILLQSCSGPRKPGILNSNNLQSSFISLNNNQSYHLRTPKGAILRIPAGAFATKSNTVQLEVKEAYSMADILLSGLSTQSDGRLLKSGGMIYINAKAEGKDIALAKSIGITIPAATYDKGMQLFKGEVKSDSTINWVDPEPLADTIPGSQLARGKMLFRACCASCHKVGKDFTGPALAGMTKRASREWTYRFIKNPAAMVEYDAYAKEQFAKWRPTLMTSFPSLTRDDINAIIDYVENEAGKMGINTSGPDIPDSSYLKTVTDCGYDTLFYRKSQDSFTELSDSAFDNAAESSHTEDTTGFQPATPLPGMYGFMIINFGWYNIDQFLDNTDDKTLTPVTLNAIIEGKNFEGLNVYLSIPEKKLLTPGYKNDDGTYIFYEKKEKVNLPLNSNAFIFAEGSDDAGKFYYGISRFILKKQQTIKVSLKPTEEKQLIDSLRTGKLGDFKLDTEDNEMKIEKRDCDSWPGDTLRMASVFNRK